MSLRVTFLIHYRKKIRSEDGWKNIGNQHSYSAVPDGWYIGMEG
jgi:hypothetical protein